MVARLSVEELSVCVDRPGTPLLLIDRVSIPVSPGACVGLVGESGCGKSLTALAIMGLLPVGLQASGAVHLDDTNLLEISESAYCAVRGRRIAMIFQEPMTALNPVRTIGSQLTEGMRLQLGFNAQQAELRARVLMDRVGLSRKRVALSDYPHQLSGGQRQRVVIALALASEPAFLVADEPTTALDVIVQQQIMRLILDIVDEAKLGLLLITHDLAVVAACADVVHVMYAGRIVEQGPTHTLFAQPRHPYTRGLLRALPQWQSSGDRLSTIPGSVPSADQRTNGCGFADRCDQVFDQCRRERPVLEGRGEQRAACWLPVSDQ